MLQEIISSEVSGSGSFSLQSQSDMSSVLSGSAIGKNWSSDDDESTVASTKEDDNASESISDFLSSMLGNPFGGSSNGRGRPSSSSKKGGSSSSRRILGGGFFSSIDEESDDDDESCCSSDDNTDDESRVFSSLSNQTDYRRKKRRGGHKSKKKNSNKGGGGSTSRSDGGGDDSYSLNGTMNKLRLNNKTTSGSTSHETARRNFHDDDSIDGSSCSSGYYSGTFEDDETVDDHRKDRSSALKQKRKKLDLNDTILQDVNFKAPPKRVDYNSDLASLYRSIDTKEWEEAGKILYHSPHTASTWVYRKDDETDGIVWMFLPIHAACFSGAPVALIRDLVRCYPKSVGVAAPGEKLPVHIACETGASHEVVAFLVDSFSESLYHVDGSGNTPLQLCIFSMSGKNRQKVMKVLTTAAAGKSSSGPKISRFRKFMGRGKRKDGTDCSVSTFRS